MLGRALADVVTVTSPQAIFLFGGLSKAGKLIFEPTQWYMEEDVYKRQPPWGFTTTGRFLALRRVLSTGSVR